MRALRSLCKTLLRRLAPRILKGLHNGSCSTAAARLLYATIDNGASRTFVGEGIRLENVREGKGYVSVANGQRERIAEVGSLGPLENVQKVYSFYTHTYKCGRFG